MAKRISKFRDAEDGAVTVDWVVLTAAVIALGIGLLISIDTATTELEATAAQAIASGDDSELK
jgi:flagellar biosynthesis protein FliQ